MSDDAVEDILGRLPIDQIATQLGESPEAVRSAATAAVPALLGGLHANAQDAGGEASLAAALTQHQNDLATAPIDASQVDQAEGEAITRHIFGGQTDAVADRLGSVGGSTPLISKLLPMLAPIVMSYVGKRVAGSMGGAAGGAIGGGVLGGVLSQIIGGATQGTSSGSSTSNQMGGILGDVLGGILGHGTKL